MILAYEPTQGVDVGSRFDIYRALRARTEAGAAVLVKSSDPIELSGLCDRVLVMSAAPSSKRSPVTNSTSAGSPNPSCAARAFEGRSLSVRGGDAQEPVQSESVVTLTTTRADSARQAVRKLVRDARDVNEWRKIVKFRLWMPVGLQIVLLLGLLWYTNSRFPGFVNATNVTNILILAVPLIVATHAQTHALLVGYIDLSVGAVISFGVVVASYLIGNDATTTQVLLGVGAILLGGVVIGLVNAGLIRG